MRILFFIDAFDSGGAARLISLIANGLSNKGHEVMVAANFHRQVSYPLNSSIKRIEWYPVHYYSISHLKRLCYLLKRARGIIKSEHPDIIVSAMYHVVLLSKLSAIGLKVPFVFADQTSYARKDTCFNHFIRWHFYKLGDAVTLLTDNDKKILGKRLPQKVVISNPLSYPIYKGESTRKKIILAVGNTDRWEIKGFDLLLKSWSKVAPYHTDWILMFVGGENYESKQHLMRLAAQYQVIESVLFGGFRSDLDLLMRDCSIFALSSRIEGFSLSLTEALSQGLPAVAYKIHGVIEEVTDGGHGTLLVEDGDTNEFAAALKRMIEDEALRKNKAKEGLKFVQKYSEESIIRKWEEVLQSVINRKLYR